MKPPDPEVGRRVIAMVAKAPRAGLVKTRLCPPLTAEAAAGLARAFLLDKIEQLRSLEGIAPAVVYAPDDGRAFFEDLAPDFLLMAQRGDGLGRRLITCLDALFAEGREGVLLVDGDTPTLPTRFLSEAVGLIAKGEIDVVLGPSEDGGYYLIGLRACRPEFFEDMPWSTPAVLRETVRRAEALGLSVALLPSWFDVDTGADLDRLRASLATAEEPPARHTRRFLEGAPS
jgi:rSAM/selenodomain-associated transferase 1